jgi:hypothetical protein
MGLTKHWCPTTPPKRTRENGYRGEHHLRDDELGEKLQRLGAK